MAAGAWQPTSTEREPKLLLPSLDPERRTRSLKAGVTSLGLHVGIVCLLAFTRLGGGAVKEMASMMEQFKEPVTLVAPPKELTQKEPNVGKVGKEFDLGSLLPRPRVFLPPSMPPGAPPVPKPAALPEPPKLEASAMAGPALESAVLPPPPKIEPVEQPKLAFEVPRRPEPAAPSLGPAAAPKPGPIEEMARQLARGDGRGGLVVSDFGDGVGGISEGAVVTPFPGAIGNSLELLSDPQGVDFRPYLIRILAAVRRNWLAIIPESAKRGRRGRVVIQFAIDREGRVPKLVIASGSGTEALDRAAVAGISASIPFPPLPADYKGSEIRLQFIFLYNMRPQ